MFCFSELPEALALRRAALWALGPNPCRS